MTINGDASNRFEIAFFDILIPAIPVAGLIAGLVFGGIDLRYEHSREQGKRRVASALISHAIYVFAILGGSAL